MTPIRCDSWRRPRDLAAGGLRACAPSCLLAVVVACLVPGGALAQLRAPSSAAAAPAALAVAPAPSRAVPRAAQRLGDHIAAVVNQDAVTAGEVERRMLEVRANLQRTSQPMPDEDELRRQVFDALIDERVVITAARDSGVRVDEAELDRAVQSVAAQNRLTLQGLRERLQAEGQDYPRFRAQVRDQILMERLREREVLGRIRITDAEIDEHLNQRREGSAAEGVLGLAHILVPIPDGADEAAVSRLRARAQEALDRLAKGEAFDAVANAFANEPQRANGGDLGSRPASRWPDLFLEAVRNVSQGQHTSVPLRSGAGFHILKVTQKQDGRDPKVQQTRARHVLLRTAPPATQAEAARRLRELRADIVAKRRSFEDVAREFSEDGSAPQGGDLGWFSPGAMVPEFEEALGALPVGGLSEPVVSRFGVHLITVVDRREVAVEPRALREQARQALREQKFEQAQADWTKELRARAYVEVRDPL